jgi:DNA-binding NtrC family response regulator
VTTATRRRILIVDDDVEILETLRDAFSYLLPEVDVLTARSGAEGLAQIRAGPVHLIIADYRMPEMDGLEFLDRAQKLAPAAAAIVISAFRRSYLDAVYGTVPIAAFFEKPFEVLSLVQSIRAQLEQAS